MADLASDDRIQPSNQAPALTNTSNQAPAVTNRLMVQVGAAAILVAVGVYLLSQVGTLWQELGMLRQEVQESQQHGVVGFLNIAPISGFAEGPKEWYRIDGHQLLLWSGWEKANGENRWFR